MAFKICDCKSISCDSWCIPNSYSNVMIDKKEITCACQSLQVINHLSFTASTKSDGKGGRGEGGVKKCGFIMNYPLLMKKSILIKEFVGHTVIIALYNFFATKLLKCIYLMIQ